jgi:hypothetical protein
MLQLADPAESAIAEHPPMLTPPSLNATVPPAADGLTVAVYVMAAPTVDGFREEATAVVVEATGGGQEPTQQSGAQKSG